MGLWRLGCVTSDWCECDGCEVDMANVSVRVHDRGYRLLLCIIRLLEMLCQLLLQSWISICDHDRESLLIFLVLADICLDSTITFRIDR